MKRLVGVARNIFAVPVVGPDDPACLEPAAEIVVIVEGDQWGKGQDGDMSPAQSHETFRFAVDRAGVVLVIDSLLKFLGEMSRLGDQIVDAGVCVPPMDVPEDLRYLFEDEADERPKEVAE